MRAEVARMKITFVTLAILLMVGFLVGTAIVTNGQPTRTNGQGMMMGMGMMGGPFSSSARPVSMERAVAILREWPAAHHLTGVVLDEVEAYTENFYGQFKESATGKGAIQVLVDRYTGRAMPEMGPNMMWNTKYGQTMMQGMMGGSMMGPGMMGGARTTPPSATISATQAKQSAAQFLAGYLPGARVGGGDAFYGYYHFDVLRGIRQVAMLSVNAESGQVWYHTWHGEFLEKREIKP